MKTQKIGYWLSTGLFCCWMLANASAYLLSADARQLCAHFGFPDYFRVELAGAKLLGVAALLLPAAAGRPREWAYAGFAITVLSGFIAHLASGDSLPRSASALLALGLLLASYVSYHRLRRGGLTLPC